MSPGLKKLEELRKMMRFGVWKDTCAFSEI